jgi:deoxyribonuclease-4
MTMVKDHMVRRSRDSRIRFGLKIWSRDTDLLDSAADLIEQGLFHYIELNVVPGTDSGPFEDLQLPTIVHATTERHGVNIADRDLRDSNLALIAVCMDWADRLGSRVVILHPGYGKLHDAEEFLDLVDDRTIAIENMPKVGINNEEMVGYAPDQVVALRKGRFGFCLDLNHAIKAAVSLKRDYRTLIREFISLKPSVFHIADGMLTNEKDEHLPIGDGEYDIAFLKHCIEEYGDAQVTFETPRLSVSLADDLSNRERFFAS